MLAPLLSDRNQLPKLAQIILHTASKFPTSAPVNLDFIGHSEGTVINTYAIVRLKDMMTPGLQAGYINDTMLDPHAANNNLPGQQLSIAGGVLAPLARSIITNYQGKAQDPPVFVPSIVDQAQVFFEHTPAKGSELYNLWGQVPVKSNGPVVHYYNLTPSKATHSGKTGVQFWYRNFIVPSLGDQAPLVQELQLNGQIDHAQVVSSTSPECTIFGEPSRRPPATIESMVRRRWSRPISRSFPVRLRQVRL